MAGFSYTIAAWLQNAFPNPYIITIIISILPMLETRAAITVAYQLGMNVWVAFAVSSASALIVCPILVYFLRPLLNLLKKTKLFKKIAAAAELIFESKAQKLLSEQNEEIKAEELKAEQENVHISATAKEKNKNYKTAIALFIFAALPLPATGVWTASAIAAFIDIKARYSIPAIIFGAFTSGLIITLLNIFLKKYSVLILFVLAIFAIITLAGLAAGFISKYRKAKKAQNAERVCE